MPESLRGATGRPCPPYSSRRRRRRPRCSDASSRRRRREEPFADHPVAELLSIPGRFRDVLACAGPLEAIEDRLRDRLHPTAWTAIEVIDQVAGSLHVSAKWVVAILEGGGDDFPAARVHAPRAASNLTPTREILASLHQAAVNLARAVTDGTPREWIARSCSEPAA